MDIKFSGFSTNAEHQLLGVRYHDFTIYKSLFSPDEISIWYRNEYDESAGEKCIKFYNINNFECDRFEINCIILDICIFKSDDIDNIYFKTMIKIFKSINIENLKNNICILKSSYGPSYIFDFENLEIIQ